jgi:hypothetical protein
MFWYGLLEAFVKEPGHCRVVGKYKTNDGYRLGRWVSHQRTRKDTMDANRRQRLEALPGWSWDPFSDQWETGFANLKQFSDREGSCRAPKDYTTDDGYQLDVWVVQQRTNRDAMDPDRRERLEALPGWSWDPFSDQWEEGFSQLKTFSEREGHCQAPQTKKFAKQVELMRSKGRVILTNDDIDESRGRGKGFFTRTGYVAVYPISDFVIDDAGMHFRFGTPIRPR